MPIEASSLVSYAAGFGLVGARVTGAFYFVPLPGEAASARSAKAILILAITLSLFSFWPLPDPTQPMVGLLVFGILKEAAIGICLGLVVSLATECLTFCFHLVGFRRAILSHLLSIRPHMPIQPCSKPWARWLPACCFSLWDCIAR